METFAKPIHAVLSNYGYNTAQDRSRVGGNPIAKISHNLNADHTPELAII